MSESIHFTAEEIDDLLEQLDQLLDADVSVKIIVRSTHSLPGDLLLHWLRQRE